MTSQSELDSLLGAFFADGPDQVADRVIDNALDQIDLTRQRRPMRVPWRFQEMNMLSRLAAAAVIGVLLVGTFFYLTRPAVPPIGPILTPGATSGPSAPAVVAPTPTEPTAAITAAPNPTSTSGHGPFIAFTRGTDKPDKTPEDPNGGLCYAGGFGNPTPPTCPIPRVWIVGSDGNGAHELFPDGRSYQSALGWSPDGARLLYQDGSYGNFYMTDASGGEPQHVDLGCVDTCQDGPPVFSSDGRHLVFIRSADNGSGIATLDLATGRVSGLSSTAPDGGTHPGWSPDGQHIVFSRDAGGYKDKSGWVETSKAAVFVVDADGQNLRQISPPTLEAQSGTWSPDGSRIVFTSPETQGTNIYTVRPDGTDLRQLTTDGVSSAATWTPDGRILFVRASSAGGTDGTDGFWTMDADGTNAVELVPAAVLGVAPEDLQSTLPLWQPSGGPAILPPPWSPSTATRVGPPPPSPVATPPALAAGFSATGSMQAAIRDWPAPPDSGYPTDTATLLADGRVLVTRGCDPTAELYDPLTGTFSASGPMVTARGGATATRLLDGHVLITGGGACADPQQGGILASAELFDPTTGTFSPTGSMGTPRYRHAATLLADGRVLVTGGITGDPPPVALQVVFASYQGGSYQGGHLAASAATELATAELYDPQTGSFSPTGSMSQYRSAHSSTLLQDGHVLVVGGGGEAYGHSLASAELYDPTSGTFSQTGSMDVGRWLHTATLLEDGRVLIAGGRSTNKTVASAEFYDPSSGKFSSAGSMDTARQNHTATLLQDGRVLIAGGVPDGTSTEIYDPGTGVFTPIGSMGDERHYQVAALLNDGRVLIAGGSGSSYNIYLNSAVLYQP